ncbi:diguanylate cyclase/phosphodiesterase (GGDEF & EAL domains) with PAS/PAC sensor(s) [Olavius sp. associated proteobacterium Delta 1]|nr:diguanylate cyclase/phosphodiesterase (GGDEF & EAL domains) with PAS/PAC sensor(s) [Olavius sp. associated proteobacterium Delta 1]
MPVKKTKTSSLADRGLIENITRFSNLLKDNGVAVSLPAVVDTLQGLTLIDICNFTEFKDLLRANLISRKEDLAVFEKFVNSFWMGANIPRRMLPAEKSEKPQDDDRPQSEKANAGSNLRSPETEEQAAAEQRSIRYSPDPQNKMGKTKEPGDVESRELYESICKLLQPLNNRLSRRLQYTNRGKQISLRRILRKNMQFGGELIFLDFKKKKLKKRRVVFFCDVSGSMDLYTLMILQFIHALKRIDRRTEIFFFATDLSRGTSQFELSDINSALSRISELTPDWGGGTRIGHCLRIFNKSYGQRTLSSKDIAIIFSDGWDRGEIEELDSQMAALKRKAHKIIWLNPLLATSDYQPICQGMRTALPYVDYFLPMGALHDLRRLNRTLDGLLI